jgi:Zn-dependent peptidase ImmA (M78 family)
LKEEISWRTTALGVNLDEFEPQVKRLIAANFRFSDLLGETCNPISASLTIAKKTSREKLNEYAETITEKWELGEVPAQTLAAAAERELNLDILYLDCPKKVSGGACRVEQSNVVFINRNEKYYRRNFDLAHEIFHILTWNCFQPAKIDYYSKQKPREEVLADSFASAMLMPQKSIEKLWGQNGNKDARKWIMTNAPRLGVSGQALFWRLRILGLITNATSTEFTDRGISNVDTDKKKPELFNRKFAERIHRVLENGLVSVGKVEKLLDMPLAGIRDVLASHGFRTSYEA